jgi:ADP-ribose pyrophosphatase
MSPDPDKPLRDRVTAERLLAAHPAYDAVELTVASPDGSERTKPAIRHRGAVVIVPLLEQPGRSPRLIVIENDRVIPGERLVECPAGGIDAEESPGETAERELREETGYAATSLYPIGSFYTSPGMSDEVMHAFVATGLTLVGQDLEPWESITVHRMSLNEVMDGIDDGRIRDGKTIAAILLAERRGYLGSR